MDNYNNDNQNGYNSYSQNNYNTENNNGYPVDPNNNSYSYTGAGTDQTYSQQTQRQTQGTGQQQSQDRYYSPYERRTMVEDNSRKARRERKRQEKRANRQNKQHGFGTTLAKCACLAATFGLVAGGVFGGVNYLIPEKEPTAVVQQQTSALSTTSDNDRTSSATLNGGIIATDVSGIVEKAMPSIVAITNMTETEYRTWFGQTYSQENDYAGSGIIVSEDDKYLYIATNNHVVDGAKTLTVKFCDDNTVAAEVKGTSPSNDLAVVKVAKDDIEQETMDAISIATINDAGNEKVGEPVIAIGNALGYGQSVTSGIISALNREVTAQDESTGETYANTLTQTDASINPGNSGGALLNAKGEVIGINSSKMGGEYVDGVGFAIPMTTAAPIVNELITREKVTDDKAAFLGVSGIDVDDTVSQMYNMPSGIYVAKVYEGSAAAEAGIQQGDIITAFDGQDVDTMEEMQELLQYRAAGARVKITISRADNGKYVEQKVEVTLGSKN